MNEIGETERALRAATCSWCAQNIPIVDGHWHHSPKTGINGCARCTYNPELLPLFNAQIAGAYAAAAKHWPTIGYCFSLYVLECSCGWRGKGSWKHVDKEQFHKEWTAHILALTPADARQASQRRPIGNRFHCFGDIIKNSNGEVLPVDEPLFLIRARDYLAIPMLERYRKVCQEDGGNDYIDALFDEIIREFVRFSVENPTKMKQPGSTRGL